MKYDDVSWHTDSVEGSEDPYPIAAGHIVAYLQWCLKRGWAGPDLTDDPDAAADLQKAIDGTITFTNFFATWQDCKFTSDDLNAEGQAFTDAYYESKWLNDVMGFVGDQVYTKTAEQYPLDDICAYLDQEYATWQSGADALGTSEEELASESASAKTKPWWRFW